MNKIPIIVTSAILVGLLLAVILAASLSAAAPGRTKPAGQIEVETFIPAITFPSAMAFAPDGSLFVNERFVGQSTPITGAIRFISSDGDVQTTPFAVLELAEETPLAEKGLLGLAPHPDYGVNRYLYVYRTAPPDEGNPAGHGEIVRYTAVLSDTDWVGSDMKILVDDLPVSTGCCHNGGALGFGPDGKLYLSIGDNGNSGNGQDLSTAAAAILRFNDDGSIPADNPFVQASGADPAIYAYGLRNVFGFDWHPLTGAMYAGENGPTCDDELNRIVSGGNYGWAVAACGPHGDPFVAPLWVLDPPQGLTGVAVHNPNGIGTPVVYMATWNAGTLFQAELAPDGTVEQVRTLLQNCGQNSTFDFNGLALAVSPAGDLYFSCQQEFFPAPPLTGAIFRIVFGDFRLHFPLVRADG